uniref:Enoyl-[acyl-carrier-protein] reductase, mitochondrial n=1 Tax=Setaria digitata TaxID=48799 RepID=A0A915PPG0_9BILA
MLRVKGVSVAYQNLYRCLTSKQLVYDSHGDPEKVLYLREVEIDSKPGPRKVRVRYLASPVNPADINQVQGIYPIKPPLPAVGGNEMVGEVEVVGDGVSRLRPGDRVVAARSGIGTWQTCANIDENDLIKIDRDLSLEASATFQVNPPTAYRMLKDFVKLQSGDFIVQNGGNSAVGRAVIQLARAWGYRTVSLVRERQNFAEIANELRTLGADYVLTEVELLKGMKTKVSSARLALNCVGGRSTSLLINCLENEGVMVTYGGMSKQPIQVPTSSFIFKNIQLRGFWMSHWYSVPGNEMVESLSITNPPELKLQSRDTGTCSVGMIKKKLIVDVTYLNCPLVTTLFITIGRHIVRGSLLLEVGEGIYCVSCNQVGFEYWLRKFKMANNELGKNQEMFKRSCFVTQLVALSASVAQRAGNIIKEWAFDGTGRPYYKGPISLRDLYTDADIAAEDCIVSSLHNYFGDSLKIIGEESSVPEGRTVVNSFDPDVLTYDNRCSDEVRQITSNDVVIWVDPLDGTYELVAAEGNISRQQEVTVLIGVSYHGRPIAGVIHQPFWGTNATGRTVWAIKGVGVHGIEIVKSNFQRYAVTTRSHSSPQIRDTVNILKEKNLISDTEFVGGAGFKVLKCLEGAAAYVFASPGCKKWDTCAPEAVITASDKEDMKISRLGGKLTDISGNDLYYGADAQISNSGGVLATAHWVDHQACLIYYLFLN